METLLRELANEINVNLDDEQISKFMLYKKLLLEWNNKINLTAITEEKEIVLKHFIDSLTVLKYISDTDRIIDVGTGAGFPGIPIKIVKKGTQVTLLDSLNKRLIFLNDVKQNCNLANLEMVHGRAEDFGKNNKYREQYNVSIARAVANLSTLVELCMPFIKIDGIFIAMKGSNIDELKEAQSAIEILGGKVEKIDNIILPNSDIERNIIIIRKIKNTPNKYPRKAGVPQNTPLK